MNQTLLAAAELLAQPDAFTKGAFARDQQGQSVPARARRACSWCMVGAINKVSETKEESQAACGVLTRALGTPIPQYNDANRTTQASAVRKLRQAARTAA